MLILSYDTFQSASDALRIVSCMYCRSKFPVGKFFDEHMMVCARRTGTFLTSSGSSIQRYKSVFNYETNRPIHRDTYTSSMIIQPNQSSRFTAPDIRSSDYYRQPIRRVTSLSHRVRLFDLCNSSKTSSWMISLGICSTKIRLYSCFQLQSKWNYQ